MDVFDLVSLSPPQSPVVGRCAPNNAVDENEVPRQPKARTLLAPDLSSIAPPQPHSQYVPMRVQQPHNEESRKEFMAAKIACQYCGQCFDRPSSLLTHMNTHTGEKSYQCTFPSCGRRFSVMSNMRRHSRVHNQFPEWRRDEEEESVSSASASACGSPSLVAMSPPQSSSTAPVTMKKAPSRILKDTKGVCSDDPTPGYHSASAPAHRTPQTRTPSASLLGFLHERGPGARKSLRALPRRAKPIPAPVVTDAPPRSVAAIRKTLSLPKFSIANDYFSESDSASPKGSPLGENGPDSTGQWSSAITASKGLPIEISSVYKEEPPAVPSPLLAAIAPLGSLAQPLKPSLKSLLSSPNIASMNEPRWIAKSAPTPRVYFKELGLESVVLFGKGARPIAVSSEYTGADDTESDTETETGKGLRFPGIPTPPCVRFAPTTSQLAFQPPLQSYIHLQYLFLLPIRPLRLYGTVLVRNVALGKNVVVRYTTDNWETASEINASYHSSLPPGIAPGSIDTPWDKFTFTIKLDDIERDLPDRTLFCVIKYEAHGVGEWCDNNHGESYRVEIQRPESNGLGLLGSSKLGARGGQSSVPESFTPIMNTGPAPPAPTNKPRSYSTSVVAPPPLSTGPQPHLLSLRLSNYLSSSSNVSKAPALPKQAENSEEPCAVDSFSPPSSPEHIKCPVELPQSGLGFDFYHDPAFTPLPESGPLKMPITITPPDSAHSSHPSSPPMKRKPLLPTSSLHQPTDYGLLSPSSSPSNSLLDTSPSSPQTDAGQTEQPTKAADQEQNSPNSPLCFPDQAYSEFLNRFCFFGSSPGGTPPDGLSVTTSSPKNGSPVGSGANSPATSFSVAPRSQLGAPLQPSLSDSPGVTAHLVVSEPHEFLPDSSRLPIQPPLPACAQVEDEAPRPPTSAGEHSPVVTTFSPPIPHSPGKSLATPEKGHLSGETCLAARYTLPQRHKGLSSQLRLPPREPSNLVRKPPWIPPGGYLRQIGSSETGYSYALNDWVLADPHATDHYSAWMGNYNSLFRRVPKWPVCSGYSKMSKWLGLIGNLCFSLRTQVISAPFQYNLLTVIDLSGYCHKLPKYPQLSVLGGKHDNAAPIFPEGSVVAKVTKAPLSIPYEIPYHSTTPIPTPIGHLQKSRPRIMDDEGQVENPGSKWPPQLQIYEPWKTQDPIGHDRRDSQGRVGQAESKLASGGDGKERVSMNARDRRLARRRLEYCWRCLGTPSSARWDFIGSPPPLRCRPTLCRPNGPKHPKFNTRLAPPRRPFYKILSSGSRSVKGCSAGSGWGPGGFGDVNLNFDFLGFDPFSNNLGLMDGGAS